MKDKCQKDGIQAWSSSLTHAKNVLLQVSLSVIQRPCGAAPRRLSLRGFVKLAPLDAYVGTAIVYIVELCQQE
jgi:hypothetical protein